MKPEAELKKLTEIPSNNNAYCKRNSDLEDVEKRDLFSKNFNCHNRARKTVLFGSPIHYLNSATNKYEDIDLSLKTNEDSVVNDTNSFKTVFNKDTKSNSVFEISKDNYTVSLKLVNQNGTKGEGKSYNKQVSDDSKFVVKDDDIEYNYKVLNNKVKDEIVINKKRDDYKYDFVIEVNNLEVQLADDGIINLVDTETGKIKFFIPRPFMVDNDGKQSNDIDCLVTKNSESSYLLSLIPNAKWLNAKERSFPVVIDPEIVEYDDNIPFTIRTYHKSFIYSSAGTGYFWELTSDQTYLDSNYRLEIILDIDSLHIPINKITSLLLNIGFLGSGIIYVNGKQFDYSQSYLNLSSLITNTFDFRFIIDFGQSTNLVTYFSSCPYAYVDFEIEYLLDNFGDTQTTLSLSPSIKANVDLADGDLTISIPDTIVKTGNLNVQIYHNFGRYDIEQNCGKYFMLNLHQKIKQVGDNYFYLNQNGQYERIDEKFYCIGNGWCRYYVQKNQLTLDSNQELVVTIDGITYKVYRELITDSGLSFSSRLENVNCSKYIDQRIDSEKEIQDYLDSCIMSLKSLELFNCNTKTRINFTVFATYESDNFSSFLGQTSYNVLAMDESAILQYLTLCEQVDSPNAGENVTLLEQQIDFVKKTYREQKSQIEKLYSNYLAKRKEYKDLKRLIPQWILDGGSIKYGFNYLGNLCAIFNDNNDYLSIVWKTLNTQNGQVEAINEIVNDDVSVLFEYSYSGQLLTINNCGKIIRYNYSGNKLEGIFLDNGEFVRLLHKTSGLLSSVATSKQMIYDFSYNNLEKVTQIKSSSFLNNINSSSIRVLKETNYYSNLSKYQISNISITYQDGKTTICDNDKYAYYFFDSNRHVYMSYSSYNSVYDNLRLSYLDKEFCLVNIYPKKTWQRVDSVSTMDAELQDILDEMNISSNALPNISSLTNGQYPNYGEADYVISYLDYFNRVTEEKTNWQKIATNKYVRTITNYFYGAQYYLNPCIKKTITHYESSSPSNSQSIIEKYKEIEEYEYDGNSKITKTKHYVLGEELVNGIDISEFEYDKKGNQIIKRSYNTLDSATKFYEESEYFDNGLLSKTFSNTGENVTHYSYDSSDKLISEFNTNGVKVSYGYDQLGALNSISQSTEIGEQNKVNRENLFDSTVAMVGGNNRVLFAYDKKRRTKAINHNGVVTLFEYSGSFYDDTSYVYPSNTSINGVQFYGYRADKIITTAYGISTETYYDKKGRLFEIKEGNIDKYRANYDSDLLQKEFIRKNNSSSIGLFINYEYDAYHRPACIDTFDNGNISLTENYGYDDYGKVIGKTLNFFGSEYDYYYSYSEDSRHILKAISIFDDYVIHPFIDENARYAGREIFDSNNNLLQKERIIYRQIGERSANVPSSVYYDSFSSGVKISSTNIKYKYDSSNNITEIRENDVLVNKYYYDTLNRLIREDNRKLNKSFFFAYDNNGNLLSKKDADYTLAKKDEILSFNNEVGCLYEGDKLISFDGESIVYDQYNRPINYRGNTMLWGGDKLVQFGNLTFSYDGLGRRISKGSIYYFYDSGNRLIGQNYQGNVLIFAYDNSGVTGFKYNGDEYFYQKNIQGDVISVVCVNTSQKVASYVYDAWGNHIVLDDSGNVVTNHSHIGFINPFRYRSYYFDDETGFYYLKSRYYDPRICRFISMDSLNYLNPSVTNGLNLWVYCYNKPLSYYDPTGHVVITLSAVLWAAVIGLIAGAVIGGTAGGISAAANGQNVGLGILFGALAGGIMGAGAGVASLFFAPVLVGEGIIFTIGSGIGIGMSTTISVGSAIGFALIVSSTTGFVGGGLATFFNQVLNDEPIQLFDIFFSAFINGGLNILSGFLGGFAGYGLNVLESIIVSTMLNVIPSGYAIVAEFIKTYVNKRKELAYS